MRGITAEACRRISRSEPRKMISRYAEGEEERKRGKKAGRKRKKGLALDSHKESGESGDTAVTKGRAVEIVKIRKAIQQVNPLHWTSESSTFSYLSCFSVSGVYSACGG